VPNFIYDKCPSANTTILTQEEFYTPPNTLKTDNTSYMVDPLISYPRDLFACITASSAIREHAKLSIELYRRLIDSGVHHRQAIMVLPGNIYIKYQTTITLSELFEYTDLKVHPAEPELTALYYTLYAIAHKVWPNITTTYTKTSNRLIEYEYNREQALKEA